MVVFSPLLEVCVEISINDDAILENDEQFAVELSTADPSVQLGTESALVTIINSDSMSAVE